MKVLITGVNGFLGYYMVYQLLQQGHSVIATGKGESRLPFAEANFVYETMDFTDAAAVTADPVHDLPYVLRRAPAAASGPPRSRRCRDA